MSSQILQQIKESFKKDIETVSDLDSLRQLEVRYLGRNSELTKVLRSLKELPEDQRKTVGQEANLARIEIGEKLKNKEGEIKGKEGSAALEQEWIDVTMPNIKGLKIETGHLHPISKIQYEIEDIFTSMGFMVLDGPELESDYYNFEALNIPSWHPARDTQDTFYIDNKSIEYPIDDSSLLLLRTHTSPVQIRAMQKYGAPIRAIVPGRVFRCEATDASHDTTFCQVEGLMIGKDISIANLTGTIQNFLSKIFNEKVEIRLRPGYFPFVEPGMEVDFKCVICQGQGCRVCKRTGWVELMGCGMVHPNVLKAGNVDPKKFQGFAFGFGLNRLVMMKYGINDIRLFTSGDLRFLEQF